MPKVKYTNEFDPKATFSFIKCEIEIPVHINNPTPLKLKGLNIYPVGIFKKIITGPEYLYFMKHQSRIKIIDVVNIYSQDETPIFQKEVLRLKKFKDQYKLDNNETMYKVWNSLV